MSDAVAVNRRAQSLNVSPQFEPFSKVVINIDDNTQVSAGDDTGRVLEIDNPQGTQAMANKLLQKIRGYQYQPYTAEGALLDPAAEIGDGVSIKDTYGGIYNKTVKFSNLMSADISAPADEEIDHEYKYESPAEKKIRREMGDVRATLLVQSNEIAAKVSQTGGSSSSFGWSLLANKFSLYAGNKEVFKATSSGVEIDGKITARTGYIGNGSSGFTITATAIYNNIKSFGGTEGKGVYIGTNGIQLGQNFKVDSNGNLTAKSGSFTGTVYAGNIVSRNSNDKLDGAYIKSGSIGTGGGSALSSGALGGIGGGANFNAMMAQQYTASNILCNGFRYNGTWLHLVSFSYKDANGNNRSATLFGVAAGR